MTTSKRSAGRPSKYTEAIVDEICMRMADGESLRRICRDEGMPAASTVLLWRSERSGFAERYARAREAQAQLLFDEILEIADNTSNDTVPKVDKEGNEYGEMPNAEWIARSRLRVDARKWYLSKVLPKVYGDKLELAGDKESPLTVVVQNLSEATKE
ncbi:terminase small subunit-like protein [Chitinasiproducens palmae]|uniref:Terminase small subunit protein n=1 Tax=Chitinasiproducens palmae TaxID=1770053 RepID=A0A1H2PQT9_9BURK|nr:terminase small subunit protein [Chitinasiproducens palmae]SDV49205.1 hypothetical protein SAMN05216551_107150 [Chitinasiproducens palmae]